MDNYLNLLPPAICAETGFRTINGSNQCAFALISPASTITLQSLSFYITSISGSLLPSHVKCDIRLAAHPTGLPESNIVESVSLSNNPVVGVNTFSFGSNGFDLSPGQLYWFCIKNTHNLPSTNNFEMIRSYGGTYTMLGNVGYGPTSIAISSNAGVSWSYATAIQSVVFTMKDGFQRGGIFEPRYGLRFSAGDSVGLMFTPTVNTLFKGAVLGFEVADPTPADYMVLSVYKTNGELLWQSESFVMFGRPVNLGTGLMTAVSESGYMLRAKRTYIVGVTRVSGTSNIEVLARWEIAGVNFQKNLGFYPVHNTGNGFYQMDDRVLSLALLASTYTFGEDRTISSVNRGVW